MSPQELQDQIKKLQRDIEGLTQAYYSNNFSSHQDFNKESFFNYRLKVPNYSTLPTTCEVGEIVENDGKLNICVTANTWAIVGNQS